jgi:hypothetical protein
MADGYHAEAHEGPTVTPSHHKTPLNSQLIANIHSSLRPLLDIRHPHDHNYAA